MPTTTDTRPEPERARELIASVRSRTATPADAAVEICGSLLIVLGYIASSERHPTAALERADVYLEEIRALLGLARGGAR